MSDIPLRFSSFRSLSIWLRFRSARYSSRVVISNLCKSVVTAFQRKSYCTTKHHAWTHQCNLFAGYSCTPYKNVLSNPQFFLTIVFNLHTSRLFRLWSWYYQWLLWYITVNSYHFGNSSNPFWILIACSTTAKYNPEDFLE